VDAKGCPGDDDNDGVPNGIDKCPGTPAGIKVDAEGCAKQYEELHTQLVETGMMRLENVNFETNKATLLPESHPALDNVGHVLKQYPDLKIEIGGHTDNQGTAKKNLKLSADRAKAVKDYLVQNFPDIKASQLTTKGYGSSKPLVPNNNATNMARNRRVEFVVLNKDVLRKHAQEPNPGH
jgi:OOP family OmpA-OmpF porin